MPHSRAREYSHTHSQREGDAHDFTAIEYRFVSFRFDSLVRVFCLTFLCTNVEFVWPRIAISLFDLYFCFCYFHSVQRFIRCVFLVFFVVFVFVLQLSSSALLNGCVRAFNSSSLYNF